MRVHYLLKTALLARPACTPDGPEKWEEREAVGRRMPFTQRRLIDLDDFFSFQFRSSSGAVRRAPITQDGFHRTRYCL